MRYKVSVYRNLGWGLSEIDETDFSNLVSFLEYIRNNEHTEENPLQKNIGGEVYELSSESPSWL